MLPAHMMRHHFLQLGKSLLSVLASLKPKRKPHWKKKLALFTFVYVLLFVILTGGMLYQYERGRYDERQLWEPKWEMERDAYRLMPYHDD